jgi:sugar phosphate isomerase/epimerase
MRYGFSTGALAKGDFKAGLAMLEAHAFEGVEVSALRMKELPVLIEAFATLPLERYAGRVSIHAPSKFSRDEEGPLAEQIAVLAPRVDGIVLHAEAIWDATVWRALGAKVLVENADGRKRTGRTANEMSTIFSELPAARMCLDLGHVYQVDPTLLEARRMLKAFGDRIGQIHLSQLDHTCSHRPLMYGIVHELRRIAHLVPDTMVILEACVPAADIAFQLELARKCFVPHSTTASLFVAGSAA